MANRIELAIRDALNNLAFSAWAAAMSIKEFAGGYRNHRRYWLFMFIFWQIVFITALLCRPSSGADLTANVTILGIEEGEKAIVPCSREGPKKVTAVWRPNPADVMEAEVRLQKSAEILLKISLEKYYRQYVGVLIDGKRFLYVHAFQVIPGVSIEEMTPHWRSRYIRICDGREASWGVEFDIETKTFRNFRRNGP